MELVVIKITKASKGIYWYEPLIGKTVLAELIGDTYFVHIDNNLKLAIPGATRSIGGFVSGYVELKDCEYLPKETLALISA